MTSQHTKKLAIFFDGTWNSADQKCPTNIAKLFEATLPDDGKNIPQIIHYVQGIGTRKTERIKGGGFGYGISDNIKDGYRFLVSNYQPGDEIYIFGFSRGAYTARSLAGMVRNVGILRREKVYLINEAYNLYKDRSEECKPKGEEAVDFRKKYTWGAETIRFLGVFDTVGALGAPFGFILSWIVDKIFRNTFHDTQLSSIVESAYHALALDERRLPFLPTPMDANERHNPSNFEQKWFPGVHSDIGGGYPNTGLSDLSLEWMVQKAQQHGLSLDLQKIADPPFQPDALASLNNSQTMGYRLVTVLTVKLPSYVKLVMKKYAEAIPYIQWNGDYIRPVKDLGDLKSFVGDSPSQDPSHYQGGLHSCVFKKINRRPADYHPLNVRW